MYPVLFRLGPIEIQSFWVMLLLGFAASTWVTRAEFRRWNLDPGFAYDLILYAYVGGLLGARLFLLFTAWDIFIENPFDFLLSGSGWVWYGGLIGGTAAVMLGTWRLGIPLRAVADAAGPAIPIAQAIGRIGCQLAGDGDYGVPTTLPWAMSYPHGTVPTDQLVHPAPVYETVLYGAIFALLWRRRGASVPGEPFGQYLILGGAARFAVEFVRRNSVVGLGLTLAQWISIASVALGLAIIVWLRSSATGGAPPAEGQA